MDKFDEMVEALEENEDLVECQECFDLFPKIDCIKQSHGYICPTCKRGFETEVSESEMSQFALTNDLYSQDFPDITEYDSESVRDTRDEPTVFDALDDLITDEYEAIEGYEVADEIVQHSDLDAEEKDDILDTIDHIKEEEEEHIDELKDLKDEDDDREDLDDDKVAEGELLEEGIPSPAGIGEGDELLEDELFEDEILTEADFKSSSADAGKMRRGANTAQNKVRQWHHKFTKAGLNLNTLADGKNFLLYYESTSAKQSASNVDGKDMREARYSDLAEAQKNAKSVSAAIRDYVTVVLKKSDLSIVDPAVTRFLEDFSTGSGNAYYEITSYNNGQIRVDNTKKINTGLKKLSVAASNLSGGRSAEEGAEIDALRDRLINEVLGPKVDSAPYTAASYGEYTKAYNEIVKQLQAASSKEALEEIDVELLKKAAEEKLEEKPEENKLALEALRDELVDMFGDKKDPEPYTEKSYAKYSEKFDKNLNAVKEAKQESTLKLYKEQLPELIKAINAVLVLKDGSSEGGGEGTTPTLDEAKKKAKDLLGEKLAKEKYTPESYEEYSKLFDAIVSEIDAADTADKLKAINIEERKKAAEAKLKLVEGAEDDDLDIPNEEDMEALKKAALDALGEKEPADPYTEESYAEYSTRYDKAVNYINKQTTKEGLDKYDYAKLAAKYKKLLKKKTDEEDIPDEEDETPNLDEAKAEAKKLLGDKLPEDDYTPESYKEYSDAFDKIVTDIDAASTMEELKAINVEERKAEAEKLLVKKTAEGEGDEEEPSDDLDKLKAELADRIMDQGTTTEDREKYTAESCDEFDAAIEALVEELEPIDTLEAFREFESKVDGRIEELRKKLVPMGDGGNADDEDIPDEEEDTEEDDKIKGKLKYTNKGRPREDLGEMDSEEYKSWGFPKQAVNAYATPVRREWQELIGLMKELVVSSGAKHTGDLQLLTKKLGNFLNKQHKSEFVFEAFRRKFMRECATSDENREMLSESLTKIFREDYATDSVTCAWCDEEYPKDMCRQEIDLGWLCEKCEQAIKSRGEELIFTEDLKTTDDAVRELKDTEVALKSTASSLSNMTSAMKESILNLSPADFAECVDSSRVELWGLEEPEDGVAHAVLIKSYDEVPSEDVQSCHDEMLDLGGMFTFIFTASGKPSLWGWNAEQLRELNQTGFKGISFDDPAYEEALSLAWRIK